MRKFNLKSLFSGVKIAISNKMCIKLEYNKHIPTMLNIEKNTNVHRTLFVRL